MSLQEISFLIVPAVVLLFLFLLFSKKDKKKKNDQDLSRFDCVKDLNRSHHYDGEGKCYFCGNKKLRIVGRK